MPMRLKKWRHPTSLEVRIYVNGHDERGKVWLEKDPAGGCRIATDDEPHLDRYQAIVLEIFEELDLKLTTSFADVVKEAEW